MCDECEKPEKKSITTDIANKLFKIFNIEKFRSLINKYIKEKYDKGINQIEKQLQVNVDFGKYQGNVNMLNEYVYDNIQGVTEEMQGKLRQTMQRAVMSQSTNEELTKKVSNIFRGKQPGRFNFQARMKMIARTEGLRAQNMAKFQGALDSGRELWKYISIINDDRTSDICHKEDRKYGTPKEAIPIRQPFQVTVGGKTYTEQYPPFHPNCRSTMIITQTNPKEVEE